MADTIDISNIQGLIDDVASVSSKSEGEVLSFVQDLPSDVDELIDLLNKQAKKLPLVFWKTIASPFISWLNNTNAPGNDEFRNSWGVYLDFLKNPSNDQPDVSGVIYPSTDLIYAILQGAGIQGDLTASVHAFQEVIADLYCGFVNAESRVHVAPPSLQKVSGIVKFGSPENGPYTFPADTLQLFNIEDSVVSLPPGFAVGGSAGYCSLGHECAGHDVLHAIDHIMDSITQNILDAFPSDQKWLAYYWIYCLDETASDVLGILNSGYSAGFGLYILFQGLGLWRTRAPYLPNRTWDVHPVDVLRGYLAADTLRLVQSKEAQQWADLIEEISDKTLEQNPRITLPKFPSLSAANPRQTQLRSWAFDVNYGNNKDFRQLRSSVTTIANVIAKRTYSELGSKSFIEIQDWKDSDDEIVSEIIDHFYDNNFQFKEGYYAAHAVCAALKVGLKKESIGKEKEIFSHLIKILNSMYKTDININSKPTSNLGRHFFFIRETPN